MAAVHIAFLLAQFVIAFRPASVGLSVHCQSVHKILLSTTSPHKPLSQFDSTFKKVPLVVNLKKRFYDFSYMQNSGCIGN
jgi:hypothetical protein